MKQAYKETLEKLIKKKIYKYSLHFVKSILKLEIDKKKSKLSLLVLICIQVNISIVNVVYFLNRSLVLVCLSDLFFFRIVITVLFNEINFPV